MVKITLKDGSVKEYEQGVSVGDIAKDLSMGLFRNACCGRIDGTVVDLRAPINNDCNLEIVTFDEEDGKKAFWHTASHVLAQAVKRLYPHTKLAIGPAIDNGFYYDFDVETPFGPDDLDKIEKEMKKIVKEGLSLERFELPAQEGLKKLEDMGEPYKVELCHEHADKGENISFYQQGDFVDLCAGPHLMSTAPLKAVKLTNCTGAYWRGDAKGKQLCRVYGTAFPKASMLEEYLTMLEEAKKRDHRKIGKDLELFTIMEEGPGFPFFLPKGMVLRNLLIDYWRELHREAGYQEISTPVILSRTLWERSGHWGHYKDNMYTTKIDDEDFAIKPMNCPGGMLVYKTKMRSYRDLPLRMGELGLVHRHELSGALHGLMRVRNFTQDDAHIFMTPDQIKDEVKGVVRLIDKVYSTFGFPYHIELSTMPEDHIGEKEDWDIATDALRDAIVELGYDYQINEGDGAFYGPKLDFHLTDCLGRTWQCGTIQLDYQLPERFELEYTGADGAKHRPVMIHRVVFGSVERFIGILTEHFAGAFPLWLAPVQIKVLPISEHQHAYAKEVADKLTAAGFRLELDDRNEKIGYKIREAQLEKVPFMLILGDKEVESGGVAVRSRSEGDLGTMSLDDLIVKLSQMVKDRVKE
ncbi:threonine--tRNA ligase [Fumia xinanensis]|uniref:Threonine--tRNA ligase n=1 Tax=Fumia xinanensis TaxID=2763659 RepID=A0A926I1G4_9FIRM|nr:threonine--tRNA ligase [Fumia xinanensis]MBC8558463.1 threonine--tRNA ligase [Fumia xinanensis]PWL42200.1 MAG: threonine--tRNA ligase [Clostridiales bacterium]